MSSLGQCLQPISHHAYRSVRKHAARLRAEEKIKTLESKNSALQSQLSQWEQWWSTPAGSASRTESNWAPTTPAVSKTVRQLSMSPPPTTRRKSPLCTSMLAERFEKRLEELRCEFTSKLKEQESAFLQILVDDRDQRSRGHQAAGTSSAPMAAGANDLSRSDVEVKRARLEAGHSQWDYACGRAGKTEGTFGQFSDVSAVRQHVEDLLDELIDAGEDRVLDEAAHFLGRRPESADPLNLLGCSVVQMEELAQFIVRIRSSTAPETFSAKQPAVSPPPTSLKGSADEGMQKQRYQDDAVVTHCLGCNSRILVCQVKDKDYTDCETCKQSFCASCSEARPLRPCPSCGCKFRCRDMAAGAEARRQALLNASLHVPACSTRVGSPTSELVDETQEAELPRSTGDRLGSLEPAALSNMTNPRAVLASLSSWPQTINEWGRLQNKVWAGHTPLAHGWIRCWSKSKDCEYYFRLKDAKTTFELHDVR